MLIWLDLRFLSDDLYSNFVLNLVTKLVESDNWNFYKIYINWSSHLLENLKKENVEIKKINIKNFSIKEQTGFLKILKKEKNNLMIFFNHFKPILYTWEYYIFISSLKEIYYWNFESSIRKYKHIFLLEKNIKNSRKVICFDNNTRDELIERFNILENKITIINWTFWNNETILNLDEIQNIDLKAKYSISNDYLIYSSWDGIEKNLDKLLYAISRLDNNTELVILWDTIAKNIFIRNIIIDYSLQKKVKFLSNLSQNEKHILYKQSIWCVFPSLYETFPFFLEEPLRYNTPIIASNIKSIKIIFWDNIYYFSPISKSNMLKNLSLFIEQKNKKIDYKNLREKYSINNSLEEFKKIIF